MSQAFDRIWHSGLLYKLKLLLPHNIYKLVESYISESYFNVNHNEVTILLYKRYRRESLSIMQWNSHSQISTVDIPQTENVEILTLAGDTAITAVYCKLNRAMQILQEDHNEIGSWTQTWRI